MAVSLEEIDRLIAGSPTAGGGLDEIDRLIGAPPPEERPGLFRLIGQAFTAPTLTTPEGDQDLAGEPPVLPGPLSQAEAMAVKPGAPPPILQAPELSPGQRLAPQQIGLPVESAPPGEPLEALPLVGARAGLASATQGLNDVTQGLVRFMTIQPTPEGEFPLKHKVLAARQIVDGLFGLGLAPFLAVGVAGREALKRRRPDLEARPLLDPTTSGFVREMLGGSPPERTAEAIAALRQPMTTGEVLELATTLGIPAIAHRVPKRLRPAERPAEVPKPELPGERAEATAAPLEIRPVEAAMPPRIEEAAPAVSETVQRAEAAAQRANEALTRMEELARRAEEPPVLQRPVEARPAPEALPEEPEVRPSVVSPAVAGKEIISPPPERPAEILPAGRIAEAAPSQIREVAPSARAETLPTKLYVLHGGRRYPVDSLEDASQRFRAVIEAANVGASETPVPLIVDEAGAVVGHVSYNGRVWPGRPEAWKSGLRPLYDPAPPAPVRIVEAARPEEAPRLAEAPPPTPIPARPPEVAPEARPAPPEPVPATFRAFVESQGRRWPLTVRDPGYAALRAGYEALRKPRYEQRGLEVVESATGRVVGTGRNGAEAQLLANQLNAGRAVQPARAEAQEPVAEMQRPVARPAIEQVPPLAETAPPSRIGEPVVEAPPSEVPPEFGSANVLFTRERKEAADARLREKGQRLTAGLDPTLLKDLAEIGGFYVEGGLREFAAWSDRMVREMGERVRPHLQAVWDEIQRQRGEGKEKGLVEVGPTAGVPPAETAPRAEVPAGPPPLEEPILRLPRHKEVLDAAEDIFRSTRIVRDKDRWPILSDQLLDMLREGTLQLPDMQRVLEARNLSLAEFGEQLFRPAVKNAAQRLQMLSALQRRLNQMATEAGTKEQAQVLVGLAERAGLLRRETDETLKALSWWRRADNVRRGLLVTQIATAVRNLETQMGRLGIDVLDRALQKTFGGEADPTAPLEALKDTVSQLRPTPKGGADRQLAQNKVDALLEAFPREWDRLMGSYSSDIAKQARESGTPLTGADRVFVPAERMVNLLNFFNRFQEFATRRSVFWAELSSRLDKRGIDAEGLTKGERRLSPEEWDVLEPDVKASVQKALEMTFAQTPAYGSVGWHFVKLVNQLPLVLSGPIPFPRFMTQSLRFLYEFSPLPILTGRAFTKAERGKWQAGDRQTMSRATIGTAMFLAAWAARESQPDENRWNEVDAPGMGTVDIRPFNPFAAYFFVGELVKRARQGTLYKIDSADIIRGIASANVRGGLGLFALDKAVAGLGDLAKTGKLKEALESAGGELLSGLLVPLRTLTDLYAQFDPEAQISRERRGEPLLGPAKAQIPPAALRAVGAEVPEPVYVPTRTEPLKREQPALRQATGLTVISEKNALERELDRFQFDRREILGPSTGDPAADNLLAKHLGALAEERLVPYVQSGAYQGLSDAEKMNALRKRLTGVRAIARGRAKREEPELFKEVKEERRPARERLLREERRERGLATAGVGR